MHVPQQQQITNPNQNLNQNYQASQNTTNNAPTSNPQQSHDPFLDELKDLWSFPALKPTSSQSSDTLGIQRSEMQRQIFQIFYVFIVLAIDLANSRFNK